MPPAERSCLVELHQGTAGAALRFTSNCSASALVQLMRYLLAVQAFGTLLLLLLYGIASIPLTYCCAFGFQSPSAAQVAVAALNFLFGFVAVNGSFVMQASTTF